MNCSDVHEALSADYDDEMPDDTRSQMSGHLQQCPECARSLAAFEQLSAMATRLQEPVPPPSLWGQIAGQLDEPVIRNSAKLTEKSALRPLSVAATVLIAIGIGWLPSATPFKHRQHDAFTAEFDHYLDEFQREPDAAQFFLVAKYDGTVANANQVVRQVGYRPVVSDGVPAGFFVEST